MSDPHCRIGAVRPKGSNVRLLRPIPQPCDKIGTKLIANARILADEMPGLQGYVIFGWTATQTDTKFLAPTENNRFPSHILPTAVAEVLRRDILMEMEVLYQLERFNLITPVPPEGA
jgi:hypothetical protein